MNTPLTDAIVDAYLEKCDRVHPDGSTSEDIERDLRKPIAALERETIELRAKLEAAAMQNFDHGTAVSALEQENADLRSRLSAAEAKVSELEASAAKAREDAERYRYAKENLSIGVCKFDDFEDWDDARIDAALRGGKDT